MARRIRLTALVIVTSAVTALVTGTTLVSGPAARATTLTGASFDAGDIVSDQVFFDSDALTEAQIQTFLDDKTGACGNSRCLPELTLTTKTRAADAMCSSYTGAAKERASRIIAKVSRACGINPEVLLVTLQKEQGLIGATAPSAYALDRAMGYGCPDTGSGCDPTYLGLYNQLYRAAWQFKRYANPPGTSKSFTAYTPGKTASIAYSPASPCGVKKVTIANQATADLYYYTPYTPNASALAHLDGTGDSCSSYGNRNFWSYFTRWFGSPTQTGAVATTAGHLDSAVGGIGTVKVAGWAIDTSTTASIPVTFSFGGRTQTVTANVSRPDVAKVYPSVGAKHGFSATLAADPGTYDLCATAVGANKATSLVSCSSVTVIDPSPMGALDAVEASPRGITVRGWAADPETSSPIDVSITRDGVRSKTMTASSSRADVAKVHPALGAAHGYVAVLPATAGSHRICVTALNVGRGSDAALGSCLTARALSSVPGGHLDSVSYTPKTITVKGWAADADTTGSIGVAVYVDKKRVTAAAANAPRPDIERIYPAYGAQHGYSVTVPATQGSHSVCVYALNAAGTPGKNALITCSTVVTDRIPIGRLDSVAQVKGGLAVSGWAFDPDQKAASIAVAIYVDGKSRPRLATSVSRPDVARAYALPTSKHGFAAVVAAAPGKRTVCAYGIDTAGGTNPRIGVCKVVTVR